MSHISSFLLIYCDLWNVTVITALTHQKRSFHFATNQHHQKTTHPSCGAASFQFIDIPLWSNGPLTLKDKIELTEGLWFTVTVVVQSGLWAADQSRKEKKIWALQRARKEATVENTWRCYWGTCIYSTMWCGKESRDTRRAVRVRDCDEDEIADLTLPRKHLPAKELVA